MIGLYLKERKEKRMVHLIIVLLGNLAEACATAIGAILFCAGLGLIIMTLVK